LLKFIACLFDCLIAYLMDALAHPLQVAVVTHGVGVVLSVLEGLAKAHAVHTERAPHGLFVKCMFPARPTTVSNPMCSVPCRVRTFDIAADDLSDPSFSRDELLKYKSLAPKTIEGLSLTWADADVATTGGSDSDDASPTSSPPTVLELSKLVDHSGSSFSVSTQSVPDSQPCSTTLASDLLTGDGAHSLESDANLCASQSDDGKISLSQFDGFGTLPETCGSVQEGSTTGFESSSSTAGPSPTSSRPSSREQYLRSELSRAEFRLSNLASTAVSDPKMLAEVRLLESYLGRLRNEFPASSPEVGNLSSSSSTSTPKVPAAKGRRRQRKK